jgi:stage VI sporulation protein D
MRKNGLGSYQIDLKETIYLSHYQLPIEEIEELELIPQIEIDERGNEIEITGCLFLYGQYRGNQSKANIEETDELADSYEESVRFDPLVADRGPVSPLVNQDKLENRIPIKITLPRGKVREVDDVYAHIHSFDYELKSPYQIEVVASLIISGLMEEEELNQRKNDPLHYVQLQEELENEEQFEFVHVASRFQESINSYSEPPTDKKSGLEEQLDSIQFGQSAGQEGEKEEVMSTEAQIRIEDEQEQEQLDFDYKKQLEEEKEEEKEETAKKMVMEQKQQKESNEEQQADNVVPLPGLDESMLEEEQDEDDVSLFHTDEEVKVAISSKGTKQDREPIHSLSSIFSKTPKAPEIEEKEVREEAHIEEQGGTEAAEDDQALYLTNFMGEKEEHFTKIKMCIMQRDETIEDIAERYQLNVESILRVNQAGRNQLGAGQILYIPAKG